MPPRLMIPHSLSTLHRVHITSSNRAIPDRFYLQCYICKKSGIPLAILQFFPGNLE